MRQIELGESGRNEHNSVNSPATLTKNQTPLHRRWLWARMKEGWW